SKDHLAPTCRDTPAPPGRRREKGTPASRGWKVLNHSLVWPSIAQVATIPAHPMTRARRLTPWHLVALATLARLLLPVQPQSLASEPPEARTSTAAGTVEGVVRYRPDPKRPWRFARYYVHESALAEAVVALEPSAGVALPPPR